MSIVDRLTLARKFIILDVVLLAVVAMPTTLYLRQSLADIAYAERELELELEGLAPMVAVHKVIDLLQEHRAGCPLACSAATRH